MDGGGGGSEGGMEGGRRGRQADREEGGREGGRQAGREAGRVRVRLGRRFFKSAKDTSPDFSYVLHRKCLEMIRLSAETKSKVRPPQKKLPVPCGIWSARSSANLRPIPSTETPGNEARIARSA